MGTMASAMANIMGQRKHVSQMSSHEKSSILKRLKVVKSSEWEMSSHALDRVKEKNIRTNKKEIVSTMFYGDIIEYKLDYNKYSNIYEERVVIRAKAIVNERYNLNVVYSLTNKSIVTVWINDIEDKHSTLDWSIYNKNMKVRK